MLAQLEDDLLGVTVDSAAVEISSDGHWDFVVRDAEISPGTGVTLTFAAYDNTGNSQTRVLTLNTLSTALNTSQLINRISFGATPELQARLQAIGPDAWLLEQLDPGSVDDSGLEAMIVSAGYDFSDSRDLYRYQMTRSVFSSRQLLEVMTWFWENHFNTDFRKTNHIDWELAENSAFRQNALGYFRDLLEISATSPAMLKYLDNYISHKVDPNENYARELMELHTLGVDGGYTQQDVEEVARAFTGWGIKNDAFFFNQSVHDTGDKLVLEYAISSSGVDEGEAILDILAAHPSTARFICTKLLQKFVVDNPASGTVDNCTAVFQSSDGQIGEVLNHILRTPEFNNTDNYLKKVKTPLEFVAGLIRNFDAAAGLDDTHNAVRDMGMPLFLNPVPTGWPESGGAWSDSSQLMQRQQFSSKVALQDISEI
ncbi:MAG: DUF1800 domain-containing protein, partial [Gammaproteobacteria bacterium]|nr:DUF1800 domain-containing protein [Gammaproteobacteria bacterium]